MIRLGDVSVTDEAVERVASLLRGGIVGQSEIIEQFEEAFAKWLRVKYCVAVSSGTMADTIALAVLKHFYPNRKDVILPALTFIAQANAVVHNGLNPVFVDVDQYMNFPMPSALEQANMNTLCFFPTHLLGRPAQVGARGNYKNIPVIEDTCEAMGSLGYMGGKCGTFGDMGTFSFYPSHTITTGEGGMISTDNAEFAALAKRLRNHGKAGGEDFHFDIIGFNGKMTSIQAALGIEALKTIDSVIKKRRENYFALGGKEDSWENISPHAFPVEYPSREERDRAMAFLRAKGVECRNLFSSVPTQEKAYAYLGHKLGDFPAAEAYGDKWLYVPVHQGLTPEDISFIKTAIREA